MELIYIVAFKIYITFGGFNDKRYTLESTDSDNLMKLRQVIVTME